MNRWWLGLGALLAWSSGVGADVRVTLGPPPGPLAPNQVVKVDVHLSQEGESNPQPRLVRMIQLDLSDTSPGLLVPTFSPVWSFAGLSGCASATTCAGYYFDNDLGPNSFGPHTASMTYVFQNEANLGPNAAAQRIIPAIGSVKVATIDVRLPRPNDFSLTLDVVNADEANPDRGAVVVFGFGLAADDPSREFTGSRASPNRLVGGRTMIRTGDPPDPFGSIPPSCTSANGSGSSLWRSQNNVVLVDFDRAITAPGAGQIEINELLGVPAGGFGANLNTGANFTFTVETGPNGPNTRLRIRENGTILTHRKWFAFRNTGAWAGVEDFSIKLVVQIGDANNDGRVVGGDVSAINACVTCPNVEAGCANPACAAPQIRRDIDGNNRIVGLDVSLANFRVTSANVSIPSGHTCP